MVNHVRTLLVNLPGPFVPNAAFPGSEYIPPYSSLQNLPAYITAARSRLFGAAPDPFMLNYRLRQFLPLLHTSPLSQFILALDSRLTYTLDAVDLITPALYLPQATRLTGTMDDLLTLGGSPASSDLAGATSFSYVVQLTGELTAIVQCQQPTISNAYLEYDLSSGVSAPLPLQGSGYTFQLNTDNPGASWFIEVINRPQFDLVQISVSAGQIGAANLDALFGIDTTEPFQSFRNLWNDQSELPLQLGAFLLAVAYRMDAVRTGAPNGTG